MLEVVEKEVNGFRNFAHCDLALLFNASFTAWCDATDFSVEF